MATVIVPVSAAAAGGVAAPATSSAPPPVSASRRRSRGLAGLAARADSKKPAVPSSPWPPNGAGELLKPVADEEAADDGAEDRYAESHDHKASPSGEHLLSNAPSRHRRRRLRRPPGRPAPQERRRRGHARRPPQLPPLPAARLPGGDRRPRRRRGLLSAAGDLPRRGARQGHAGGGDRASISTARPWSSCGHGGGRGDARLRHADRRRRLEVQLLRPPRMAGARRRAEVAGGRAAHPRADPAGVRGGRGRRDRGGAASAS